MRFYWFFIAVFVSGVVLTDCAHAPPTPEEQEQLHWLMVRQCNELCKGRGLLRLEGDKAHCYCVTT